MIETNPAFGSHNSDAGGAEWSRVRWPKKEELVRLARVMPSTPNFGRPNELVVWRLLALRVGKRELLSARWSDFDLEAGVWHSRSTGTRTRVAIDIPLAPPVIEWLKELQAFACGAAHLFAARRRIHRRKGIARKNRFGHISPDTLNVPPPTPVASILTVTQCALSHPPGIDSPRGRLCARSGRGPHPA